ncbi:hypothetical protein [Paratissierella segnis]|jgi:hypothetical protein|uniref:Uncharacterized protein n=1 Tax=Paratissierella segnis TaxID=2763679 RepID=A0A926ILH2_9FIRM|nr:hypothetical protein [Paratissierella segnis]MBC8588658.1 hypothetical protein [Paratissierella segnis]
MFFNEILIMLFIISVIGYILVVVKEKFYLKNNMIIIDNKNVTQEHLDETDLKEFFLDGKRIRAGDEIKVITKSKDKFIGTIIGATQKEKAILMITNGNQLLRFKIDNIAQFKIISKYGKFFT